MRIDFNSIKVQLEHGALAWLTAGRELFQFHKGTIRTRPFQYIAQDSDPHFNSIKVQLEQEKAWY